MSGYNKRGVRWTDELVRVLTDLKIEGLSSGEIARRLSSQFNQNIKIHSVENKLHILGLTNLLPITSNIKVYKNRCLPEDDYMISCDWHSPFYSELWANRFLAVAEHLKIRKHIIVGDLFDCDWAKAYPSTDGEERPGLDGEAKYSDPLIKALLEQFDENIHECGNHETRAARNIARIQFRHVAGYLGLGQAEKRYAFTEYDRMEIGSRWLLVHPKSYSQISGSVAVRLAEKFHRHVLNAHGHFIALRFDRSGEFMGVDLGGMFDQRKVAYSSLITTTHPMWNNGFGVIKDGYFHHFHAGTDLRPWTGKSK